MTEIKEVYVYAGDEIEPTIKEAIAMAQDNNCFVKFSFNDVKFLISKHDNFEKELEYYSKQLRQSVKKERG